MSDDKPTQNLEADLRTLGLNFMAEHYNQSAATAARDAINHADCLLYTSDAADE